MNTTCSGPENMKIFLFQANNKNFFFQIRKNGLHRYSEYMVNVIFFLESGIETKRIQDRVLVGRGITSRRGEQDNRYWFLLQRNVQRHHCRSST